MPKCVQKRGGGGGGGNGNFSIVKGMLKKTITILRKEKTPHLKINVNISQTDQTEFMIFEISYQSSVSHEDNIAERIFEAEKTTSV